MQRLQRDHTGHHIARHARPSPPSRKQVGEHLIGKQLPPMRRQEPKHTARPEQITRYRLRIPPPPESMCYENDLAVSHGIKQ